MKFVTPLAVITAGLICCAGLFVVPTTTLSPSPLTPTSQATTSVAVPSPVAPAIDGTSRNPFDLTRPSDLAASSHAEAEHSDSPLASADNADDSSVDEHPTTSHTRMLEVLEKIRNENRYEKRAFGREPVSTREHRLLLSTKPIPSKVPELFSLAEHRLWRGDTREAIAHLQAAQGILETSGTATSSSMMAGLLGKLGLASLRLAENENCVDCNNAASCLLPIEEDGVHQFQEGSLAAVEYLQAALAITPSDFTSRWLLNVAAMTLGTYPDAVPVAFQVDPARFESEADFPRFRNTSAERGVNTSSLSGGSVADDFDGDGDLDLIVSSWGASDSLQFFRNTSDAFIDDSEAANFSGLYGGLNMLQADYDNDGDVDLLVLRGAWLEKDGCVPNSLLDNDGTGHFTDVTFRVGLARPAHPTQTASWLDYDNDGDLDLFVGNEHAPCQLFENLKGRRFREVTQAAQITINAFVKGVSAGDYNNDGFPDVYVSVLEGPNHLLHNNGDGTFTDVAAKSGVREPRHSFPTWFWDANQDGNLDIFVSSYTVTLEGIAERFFGKATEGTFTKLYEGDGKGNFRDVAADRNFTNRLPPMGANFGDLNNDGYPEVYLGTGAPAFEALMPNVMYLNDRGAQFLDITSAGGFGHLQKGHGISFADYDNDGDQDVFAEMGGAYPGDRAVNCLFENPGFGNHWITIQLVGHRSNRSAIGARVAATVREGDTERTVYHWVGSGGSFGCNPLRCEIGLGQATAITRLEVHWPASQTTQVFGDVQADQFIRIDEDSDVVTPLAIPAAPKA